MCTSKTAMHTLAEGVRIPRPEKNETAPDESGAVADKFRVERVSA
jgi:hypothetical protein